MESTLWEVVTCNTPAVKKEFNLVEPGSDEANELEQEGELFPIPADKGLSAKNIIQYVCDIMLEFPNFGIGEVSDLSAGMLLKNANDGSGGGIIHDILLPNLYCVLALEAIGQRKSKGADLKDIVKSEPNGDLSNVSRLLSEDFPLGLKELFAVHKKNEKNGSPYQISTQFPELFRTELMYIRASPASKVESSRNSLRYSKRFYDKCIQAISRTDTWTERSFAEYFLFERTFRLNTKLNLCYAEYQAKDRKVALSPKILADFFFHSPLVIFPKMELECLLYEGGADAENYRRSMQFLHFLIQLSSVWFPQVLNVLRVYMEDCNIQSFEAVNSFFFPWSADFTHFQATYTPVLNRQADSPIPRALLDRYSGRWSTFKPDSGYCAGSFTPYSLEDWSLKAPSEYPELVDNHALREIQDTI